DGEGPSARPLVPRGDRRDDRATRGLVVPDQRRVEAAHRVGRRAGDPQVRREDRTAGAGRVLGRRGADRRGGRRVTGVGARRAEGNSTPPRSSVQDSHEDSSMPRNRLSIVALTGCLALLGSAAGAAERAPSEDDYYRLVTFAIPDGIVLEVGALEM